MAVKRLQHFNIRCASDDLQRIAQFYVDVAGLSRGPRPALRNPGEWLYLGADPVIHVSVRCEPGFLEKDHRGSVDHIAFEAHDAAATCRRLQALGIPYQTSNVAGAGYQIFISDPVGTAVELNFPNSEAPRAAA